MTYIILHKPFPLAAEREYPQRFASREEAQAVAHKLRVHDHARVVEVKP